LPPSGRFVAAMPADAHDHGHHPKPDRTVDVQLLSFKRPARQPGAPGRLRGRGDGTSGGRDHQVRAGRRHGVPSPPLRLRTARQGHPYSITAAGGDMIGASPLLSGLFHDEPTIEALNKLKLDVTAVGNHEFDEGATELARMQNGGCHPTGGCYEKGKKFRGADFPYLAANVTSERTGKPILKPYTVWQKNGVKIGFIGVTLEGTPNVVTAAGVQGPQVRRRDRDDQQVRQGTGPAGRQVHRRSDPRGRHAVQQRVQRQLRQPGPRQRDLRPHRRHSQGHHAQGRRADHRPHPPGVRLHHPGPGGNPRMVTSAASFGKLYTDTALTYDRRTNDIIRTAVKSQQSPKSANTIVSRDQPKGRGHVPTDRALGQLAAPVAGPSAGLHLGGHQRPRLGGRGEAPGAT